MDLLVSPYHFTTREPPVMAALLLADRVYTLLPSPGGGREDAQRAADRVPEYLAMMRSWRWSEALWREGVVLPSVAGDATPAAEMALAWRRLTTDPACAPLAPLMRLDLFHSEDEYLQAVARDVLRAGPDPGVSVPVMLGLDRYAARHSLTVVRPEPASLVQKAEQRLAFGAHQLTLVLPVLLQADADSLALARELLAPELEPLRRALDEVAAALTVPNQPDQPDQPAHADAADRWPAWRDRARQAAARYAQAFEAELPELAAHHDADEVALLRGVVSLTLSALPVDVVLHASAAASCALRRARSQRRGPDAAGGAGLAIADELAGRAFSSMVVRVMGREAA